MNVLKSFKQSAVWALLQRGVSQHEIARKIGVDRKTIRTYQKRFNSSGGVSNSPMATGPEDQNRPVEVKWPPASASGKEDTSRIPKRACSHCLPHHDWIVQEVNKGRNAMSIYQDLVERFAFTHRYNSVKRYVRRVKKKDPEQYDRLEFLPGEEAQVDYGLGAFTIYPKTGKRRRPRLFVMTLRYSRRSFRKVVWKSSKEQWAKLHEEAFRYFGGCPQYIVLDNLKEGILKPDLYEPELNPVFQAMLAHYGVVADPCRVRDPDRKGTVESGIQHTQNTALKGREYNTIEEQNTWLMQWEERWASKRIHGTTKRQVQEMFVEEKSHLKSLPLQSFRYFEQGIYTVWDDGCVEVKSSFYSALPAPLYSKVLVRIYDTEIEIYDQKTLTLIRRHARSVRKGKIQMEEDDRIFNPSRMTQTFLDQAGKIGPKTEEICKLLFQEQGRCGQRKMRGIVSLSRKHQASLIEKACTIAVEHHIRSSKTVRELVERMEEKEVPHITTTVQSHELIRSLDDYGAFFEHHAQSSFFNQPGEEKRFSSLNHKEDDHVHVTRRD